MAVLVGLVGVFHLHIDVFGFVLAELGELGANTAEVEASHHFIEMPWQHIHLFGVPIALGEQFDLSQHLVGEGVLITKPECSLRIT